MRVTTLTAVHVLRYMLAEAGYEEPLFQLPSAFPIFGRLLLLEAEGEDDASFQVRWGEGGPSGRTLVLACTRELTGTQVNELPDIRIVGLEFMYEGVVEGYEPEEVWRSDFDSLEAFVAAIMELRAFRFGWTASAALGTVLDTVPDGSDLYS